MKKGKVIWLWILFGLFVVLALGSLPHFSGFIALLTAALVLPIAKWQEMLQKYLKKTLKTILVVVLALTTVFTLPSAEPSEVIDTAGNNDAQVSTTTMEDDSLSSTATQLSTTTAGQTVITTTKIITTTSTVTAVTTKAATTTKKITTTTKKPTTTKKITTTTKKPTTTKKITTTTEQRTKYVLNTESKKFHHITCKRLPTKNREDVTMSREEIISMGYSPCGFCDP